MLKDFSILRIFLLKINLKMMHEIEPNNFEENGKKNFYFITIILLIFVILGLSGIILTSGEFIHLSNDADKNKTWLHIIRDISVTLSAIGIISLVYEYWLRKSFLKAMSYEVDKVIKMRMPPRYSHLRELGIVDAYENLDVEKLRKKLKTRKEETIKILKMWMPDVTLLGAALIEAVDKGNCDIQIILLDPDAISAIEARVGILERYSVEDYRERIISDLKELKRIKKDLEKLGKGENLIIKTHKSFVATSMVGWDGTFIFGLYLHDRIATHGSQIKVCETGKVFYDRLQEHFQKMWNNAETFDFDRLKNSEKY